MSSPTLGFQLRFISFFGPSKEVATVNFGPGLNVIYGASDTGKSFVVQAIDYMLGGRPPLREIEERQGYDCILLGIETLSKESFTIERSSEGGGFRVHKGLHAAPPDRESSALQLADSHSDRNDANLSTFLLGMSGLAGRRVRRNAKGETNSLSFRNIASLLIVTETEITQERSPLLSENVTTHTVSTSVFKLLLSGLDDSMLVSVTSREPAELSRDAQLELLAQLLADYKDRLRDIAKSPDELEQQLQKIDSALAQYASQLVATESEFQKSSSRRRELRTALERGRDRKDEVDGLITRFELLAKQYESDISRLHAIEEGGRLFSVLGKATCPLCGAAAEHQGRDVDCDGNVSGIVEAAQKEIQKILLLRDELALTMNNLGHERSRFARNLPRVEEELENLATSVDGMLSPKLSKLRETYSELADKRGQLREALSLYSTVKDLEGRHAELSKAQNEQGQASNIPELLPTGLVDQFARHVEIILEKWHFPDFGRVHFDLLTRDLVIAGKPRGARGKGLRAITHAAFNLGLLAFCRKNGTPHPGFVVLDSPLLAYRKPDGTEDDLQGTDLDEQFYSYLQSLPSDQQVIVIENTDPPLSIKAIEQCTFFSKNQHQGRFGFFPYSNTGFGAWG
jgi:prefoldin subunit 5